MNSILKLIKFFIMPYALHFTAATIGIGLIQSRQAGKAAKAAAGAQVAAGQEATAEQRRQFDISREAAEPFRQAGLGALEQQQALLGLAGPEARQQALAGFQESPGQQFIRQRQERALLRNQAAIGGLGGGNVRTALQQQAAGFAQQDLQNQLARLGGIAGQGQVVTSNIAQLGAGTATNIGNLLQAGGQAQASGILGAQQAQGQFLGQIGGGLRGAAFAGQTPGVSAQQGFLAGFR